MDKYYTPEIEIWKDIIGYENEYEISNLGDVRRKIKNLTKIKDISGYEKVTLCKNGKCTNFSVHRLVAQVFLPNPEDKEQVHHRDFVKDNNKLKNLEWVTPLENIRYNVLEGITRNQLGEKNNMSKLSKEDVLFIRELLNDGLSVYEIHKDYFPILHQQTIYAIKNKRIWNHI